MQSPITYNKFGPASFVGPHGFRYRFPSVPADEDGVDDPRSLTSNIESKFLKSMESTIGEGRILLFWLLPRGKKTSGIHVVPQQGAQVDLELQKQNAFKIQEYQELVSVLPRNEKGKHFLRCVLDTVGTSRGNSPSTGWVIVNWNSVDF